MNTDHILYIHIYIYIYNNIYIYIIMYIYIYTHNYIYWVCFKMACPNPSPLRNQEIKSENIRWNEVPLLWAIYFGKKHIKQEWFCQSWLGIKTLQASSQIWLLYLNSKMHSHSSCLFNPHVRIMNRWLSPHRSPSRPPETIAKTLALAAQERSVDTTARVRWLRA